MRDDTAMEDMMSTIRHRLITLVTGHERRSHAGNVCAQTRYDAIAFLAHCLGVAASADGMAALLRSMHEYNLTCPGCAQHDPPVHECGGNGRHGDRR